MRDAPPLSAHRQRRAGPAFYQMSACRCFPLPDARFRRSRRSAAHHQPRLPHMLVSRGRQNPARNRPPENTAATSDARHAAPLLHGIPATSLPRHVTRRCPLVPCPQALDPISPGDRQASVRTGWRGHRTPRATSSPHRPSETRPVWRTPNYAFASDQSSQLAPPQRARAYLPSITSSGRAHDPIRRGQKQRRVVVRHHSLTCRVSWAHCATLRADMRGERALTQILLIDRQPTSGEWRPDRG